MIKKLVGSRLDVNSDLYQNDLIKDKAYQAPQTLILVITEMHMGKIYKLALSLCFDTSSSALSHTISSIVTCYNLYLFSCILCLISIYFSCKCRMTTTQPEGHFDLSQLMPQELQTWLDGWFTNPPRRQFQAYSPLNAYLQGHKFSTN